MHDRVLENSFYIGGLALVVLMEFIAYLLGMPRIPWVYGALAMIAAAFALLRIGPIKSRMQRERMGCRHLDVIEAELEALRAEGAKVFTNVQGQDFRIEHVIVNARGIVAVETAKQRAPEGSAKRKVTIEFDGKRVLIDGWEPLDNPVAQLHAQIRRLQAQLKRATGRDFPVLGALLFPNACITVNQRAGTKAFWVLEPEALAKRIEKEHLRLVPEDFALVTLQLARHSEPTR